VFADQCGVCSPVPQTGRKTCPQPEKETVMTCLSPQTRFLSLAAIMLSFALLGGCGSSPKAQGEKVAKQWLDALNAGNVTRAQELSTEPTAALIQMATSMGSSLAPGKYRIAEVTERNPSSVGVKVVVEEGDDMALSVMKVDGNWKVGMQK
jgi:hypothetical protein